MTDLFYSAISKHEYLEVVSSMWTNHYNSLISQPWNEDWENKTFKDLILSEKVFDI